MSGLLFLFEVAAFVYVAYWAYENDRSGARIANKGLLRMMDLTLADAKEQLRNRPQWQRDRALQPAADEPEAPRTGKAPGWKSGGGRHAR